MDFTIYLTDPTHVGDRCARYVDTLLSMGCDGVKMWEGKPNIRKLYGVPPFDSPIYAPYWEKLAAYKVPVLLHLNDPAELWDPQRVPAWALQYGWFYGDGTYVNNETQFAEIIRVLERHPDLTLIAAHFMFLSAELPRLAGYLDRFPNLYVDLAPGTEMYRSFSANPEATRRFFLQYQDRILFGTDYGAGAALAASRIEIDATETCNLYSMVRQFLETDGEFGPPRNRDGSRFYNVDFPLRGIALPSEALQKIYVANFDRIYGPRPQAAAIVEECTRLIPLIDEAARRLGTRADPSVIAFVREYFARV
jgi:hypothetical protein